MSTLKLVKAVSPTKAPKPKVYSLTVGTPNAQGETRNFVTIASVLHAADDFFDSWKPWCERHNKPGIITLETAKGELGFYTGDTGKPFTVNCLLDEHTNTRLRAVIWRNDLIIRYGK